MKNVRTHVGTSHQPTNLRMASLYARERLAVVPLHGMVTGRCTCGDEKCSQPGRHPRTKKGLAGATTDPIVIEKMWSKWPTATIGIALGGSAKLLALVIDGGIGWHSLRKILATGGHSLPRTVTIQDHDRCILLFRSAGAQIRSRIIADGVQILGDSDLIVAPSSLDHSIGKRGFATGRTLRQIAIATAPQWLLLTSCPPPTPPTTEPVADVAPNSQQTPVPTVVLVRTSEIEPTTINWIWPGIIASARITGLVGFPGTGKSQVAIDVAATVSTGRMWPGGVANGSPGDVIILSAEDDTADTIVPRLMAAGADRSRVRVVKAVKGDDGVERPFDIAADLNRLENEYDLHQVRLLVVDPISAYLGAVKRRAIDQNEKAGARAVLNRLTAFAARHDLGVLTVSHLNKTGGAKAIARVIGSLEWVAVPRAVFMVTEEAQTGRRLFLPLKNNLALDRIGYAFDVEGRVVADGIRTSTVVWSGEPVTISADEALSAAAKKATSGAVDFLQQLLKDGPVDQAEIVRLGEEAGYSGKALRIAREKLGVTPKKEGFGARGKWIWVPAGGARVLKSVVDNDENKQTVPDGKKPHEGVEDHGDALDQEHRSGVAEPGGPEVPDGPDGPASG